MSAATAYASLMATLQAIPGMQVQPDVGRPVQRPPALVISPPTLTYEAYGPEPTEATFKVALVVAADERAVDRLLALLTPVQLAVHESADAAMSAPADPGFWGTPPLPCYLLTIEVTV